MKTIAAIFLSLFASCALAEVRVFNLEKQLQLAGQANVRELAKIPGEYYRYISYDPGFTSSTIILITKSGSNFTMNAYCVSLHDYYASKGERGVRKQTMELSETQWREIMEKLSKLDFWNYKAKRGAGLDGQFYILEGVKDGAFRSIQEWFGPREGIFWEACRSFDLLANPVPGQLF